MGKESGQTATEYLGVIVLVAAIVAAIMQTDVGTSIAGGIKTKVCEIAGSGDCGEVPDGDAGETVPVDSPLDPEAPTEGPPLSEAPADFPVLPFPGTVGVSCTAGLTGPKAGKECTPDDGPFDAGVRTKGEFSRSNDVDNTGCPTTSLSVKGSFEAYGNANVGDNKAGAGYEVFGGASQDYSVTTTPDQADEYEDGADLPNPLDPRTLQTGEGLELGRSYYDGNKLSATYRGMQAAFGFEEGRRLSSGVQKLDSQNVRIYVGDEDYVKRSLAIGNAGGDFSASLGAGQEISEGKLRAIDIDISTKAGWKAYQQFAATGAVPEPGSRGTSNPATAETADIEAGSGPSVTVGGQTLSVGGSEDEGHRTVTTDADGNVTYAWNSEVNGRGIDVVHHEDTDGNETAPSEYALNLEDVDRDVLADLDAFNGSDEADGVDDGTVRLDFSEDDLQEYQDLAIELNQRTLEQDYGESVSREDIIEAAQTGDPLTLSDGGEIALPGGAEYEELIAADTPDEQLIALSHFGRMGPSSVLSEMAELTKALQARRAADDAIEDGPVLPLDAANPGCA